MDNLTRLQTREDILGEAYKQDRMERGLESLRSIVTRSALVQWLIKTDPDLHRCVFDSDIGISTSSFTRYANTGHNLHCVCGRWKFFPNGRS